MCTCFIGTLMGLFSKTLVIPSSTALYRPIKAQYTMNSFFLSLLLLLSLTLQSECKCYKDWKRCVPKYTFATGIIWKNCAVYCQKCKGRAGGHCEKVYKKECNGGFQCRCAGPDRPKSKNPVDIATCKLGL
ncbi:unnamed protein product [Cylicocyclus nassatus]|uniref:Uncharacterized protein n=1 Tax=Cylicocyclus nassatus TaxID=53992 RepID=A0AA36M2X5_CYLNA|nr:unnamed protein product [Cylicocyclus nassatus]